MAPKKRKKLSGKVPPPGVGHRQLTENFSQLPKNIENLKNGHVLYIYEEKANQSRADTGRELKTHYFPSQKLSLSNSDRTKTLVNRTFNKLKNLSDNAKQFEDLQMFATTLSFSIMCTMEVTLLSKKVLKPETSSSVSPSHDPVP